MRTKEYFEENSQFWINDAYNKDAYNYPVGLNRLRILNKILKDYDGRGKTLVDIGCGGGDISLAMAEKGFNVIGVDMSEAMLEIANERKASLPVEISNRIEFVKSDFKNIKDIADKNSAEVVIAFGLIGYLEDDDIFFDTAKYLLKDSGKLIVSFRNRLFNMESVSDYTVNEINQGNALALISQLGDLFSEDIPRQKIKEFMSNLKAAVNNIDIDKLEYTDKRNEPESSNTLTVEARQQTPNEVRDISEKYGLYTLKTYGVHPHLLVPKLNKMLTPQLFNILSDCLCAFEDLPVSLSWSSVFINEFEKRS